MRFGKRTANPLREPMRFGKKADFLREPMRFGKRKALREPMRFGKRLVESGENIGPVMEDMEAKGLLKVEHPRVFLTERGMDLSNYVMSRFLLD